MAPQKNQLASQDSGFRRGLNQFYRVFLMVNICFMLALDLQIFIPASIKPKSVGVIREWYIQASNDQFFIDTPPFLHAYFSMELVYSLPLNLWAVWVLGKGHRLIPLQLLIWGVATFIQTITCAVEINEWTNVTEEEKWFLLKSYGAFLVPVGIMIIDMSARINERL